MMKKNLSLLSDDHDHHKKKKIIGCSSSSTANGEDELTEDLILEIFSHLPIISLLRFKSVSKTFHSLISNPDFLRRNAVHQFRRQDTSPPPPGILLKRDVICGDSKILIFPPPPLPHGIHGYGDDHQHYGYSTQLLQNLIDYRPEHNQPKGDEKVKFWLIDSCNGLLLLCLNCYRDGKPPKHMHYVCNPITKDYIKLPTFEEEQIGFKPLGYWSAKLVFDPSLSLTYKVVIWLKEHGAWILYVYSSETRSWRLSVSLNINDFRFHVLEKQSRSDYRAVLLNGVLYWSTLIAITMVDVFDVLLCYDFKKDSVWTLKFPKMPVGYVFRKLYYFGVCGGGLRLIENYYNPPFYWRNIDFPSSFDVMEMNQLQLQQQHDQDQDCNIDRDLWTVKYRVNIGEEGYYANLIKDLNESESMFGVFILDLYKTTTTKAEEEEEEEMLLCISNGYDDRLVISFNLSDNTFGNEHWLTNQCVLGCSNVLRFANITLFPLNH